MNLFLKIYMTCLIWLAISFFALPACVNYNMDINNVPDKITKQVNTRFSCMEDLIKPAVAGGAMAIFCPIVAPILTYYEYELLTNQTKYEVE